MSDLTLRDLYTMMARDYGGRDPLDLALAGDRWVMDDESFRSVIAACKREGVIYPPDYEPGPQDRLFGLPVDVREGAGAPHVERG